MREFKREILIPHIVVDHGHELVHLRGPSQVKLQESAEHNSKHALRGSLAKAVSIAHLWT